ncbi:MAG: hypothetical protein CVU05_02240 [Bacteroidetes bacterium HGW-Bacteroidetes-21]|nr:MAG: hypothetical protein CVU05_02240 [Bacteroidetes bacterium HGW-Bacteroidetes-21]
MRNILTTFFLFFFLYQTDAQVCLNPVTSNCADAIMGTSEFLMTTSGNVDFVFDDMRDFITGITHSGSTMLRLRIDEVVPNSCRWRLMMYIDNNSVLPANEWETLVNYGTSGQNPELDLIEVKIYNGCGTPLNSGVFQIFAGNTQYDLLEIIPMGPRIVPAPCDGSQVNGPGSYLTDYNEYSFTIDYRIKPGYILKPGAYQIKIHFCLVEV